MPLGITWPGFKAYRGPNAIDLPLNQRPSQSISWPYVTKQCINWPKKILVPLDVFEILEKTSALSQRVSTR